MGLPFAALVLRLPGTQLFWQTGERLLGGHFGGPPFEHWAQAELRRHDVPAIIEAAGEIGRFSSHSWVHEIDVPTAVVVHAQDQLVPARRQRKLAQSIPGAQAFEVDGDHFAVAREPEAFLSALEQAIASVVGRVDARAGRPAARLVRQADSA